MVESITNPFSGQETVTCSVAMKYTDKQIDRMKRLGLTEAQYEARLAAARDRGAKRRGGGKEERPKGEAPPAVKPTSHSTGSLTDEEAFGKDLKLIGDRAKQIKELGYTVEEWDAKIARHLNIVRGRVPKVATEVKPPPPKHFPKPAKVEKSIPPPAPAEKSSLEWTKVDQAKLRSVITVQKNREVVEGALDHQGRILGGKLMSRLRKVEEHAHPSKDTLASYIDGARQLRVSPAALRGGKLAEHAHKTMINARWFTKKGDDVLAMDHTIAHEIGHFVADQVLGSPQAKKKFFDEIADTFGIPKPPLGNRNVLDRWVAQNPKLVQGVSRYGVSDSEELIAEIWAEYTRGGDHTRPEIKRIGRKLEQMAKEFARDHL